MSSYENYSQTAKNYDTTRVPTGIEVILGAITTGPVSINQARVLDAGCGTGSYSAVMAHYVAQVCAVDLNREMLAIAKEKLPSHVLIQQASIECLPFEDRIFDAIMVNQVLHHISDDSQSDYPLTRKVFFELARVLKTDGRLILNTCGQDQLSWGWWYYHLIPNALADMRARHIPIDVLCRLLSESGFNLDQRYIPMDALIQGEDYFNPWGPLSLSWRNGDSMWACASAQELKEAISKVQAIDRENGMEGYMRQHDVTRGRYGQVTFVLASRR